MHLDLSMLPEIIFQLFVSITLALLALVIGIVISFVLAAFGASNLAPHHWISQLIKGVVAVIRAVPSLVWILMVRCFGRLWKQRRTAWFSHHECRLFNEGLLQCL